MKANRVKLKICGVNDAAFAREAERLGADYIGLIFAEGSPRRVTVGQAKAILSGLVGGAEPVGVFTTTPVEEIAAQAKSLGLHTIQLHRRATAEDVAYLRSRGLSVWALAGGAEADAMLFDSSHGDGETVLGRQATECRPAGVAPPLTVLAGGISSANIRDALSSGADIVDVSGSLESAPGVKSIEKLHAFMSAYGNAASAAHYSAKRFLRGKCVILSGMEKPATDIYSFEDLRKRFAADQGQEVRRALRDIAEGRDAPRRWLLV